MTWVRRDDQASIHRKVAPLDDATYRLWSEAIEWSSRNLTDGQIGDDELAEVSKRGNKVRAAKLVERGLWHVAGRQCLSPKCPPSGEGGWVIHDYLDYQPSREKVRAEQAAKAERQRRWMERRKGDASKDEPRDASQDGSVTPTPSPPRPEGKRGGDLPVAPDDRRDAAASAADGRKPATSHGRHPPEDPQAIAADQRRLAAEAADRERANATAAERASNGAAAARAAILRRPA